MGGLRVRHGGELRAGVVVAVHWDVDCWGLATGRRGAGIGGTGGFGGVGRGKGVQAGDYGLGKRRLPRTGDAGDGD